MRKVPVKPAGIASDSRCALSATCTQHPLTPPFIMKTTTVIRLSVAQRKPWCSAEHVLEVTMKKGRDGKCCR
jgi:hypothetical protein